MLDVADDADDFARHIVGDTHTAIHRRPSPEHLGRRAIDDRDGRSTRSIARLEISSAVERDSQRAKVPGIGRPDRHPALARPIHCIAISEDRERQLIADQRQIRNNSRRSHARRRRDLLEHPIGESRVRRAVRIPRSRQRQLHRDGVRDLEPGIDSARRDVRASDEERAGGEHQREGDLACQKEPAETRRADGTLQIRAARLRDFRARDQPRRTATEQDRRGERCDDRHEDRDRIDVRGFDTRQTAGAEHDERAQKDRCGGDADRAAGAGQREALHEQLPGKPARVGAERRAQRDLVPARRRPRQQQIRRVRASGEQDEQDCRATKPQRTPHITDEGIEERPYRHALVAIGARELSCERRGGERELRLRGGH